MMAIMMWYDWIDCKDVTLETKLIHMAMVKQVSVKQRAWASKCLRGRY